MVIVKRLLFSAVCLAALIVAGASHSESRGEPALNAYGNLPLTFTENRGQTDPRVRFFAQGNQFTFHLTPDEVVLSLVKQKAAAEVAAAGSAEGVVLGLRFLDRNPGVVVEGEQRAEGQVNYFHGSDSSRWQTGLSTYGQVVYRELWPGIDLNLRGHEGSLKYEFRVKPGAKVDDIRMAYAGSDSLSVDASGALLIGTRFGALRDTPPVAYQEISGVRLPIKSGYALHDGAGYGFELSAGYDPQHELIIDPGLEYSTYLGGASHENGAGIAVDSAGNAYVMGITQSPDFPTVIGSFDRTGAPNNFLEVFVSKLNPTGTALIYSTFLGGSNFEWGRGMALDAAGNVYIAGQTKSSDFPTTGGAFDRTFNVDTCPRCGIDQEDAFVTKLNPTGSALVYSTFLGGFDLDDALGIAVDAGGNAYVTGETGSLNFPITAGAVQPVRSGAFDAFITKFNAAGSAIVYSTYLGGAEVDFGQRVVVDRDGSGNAYVLGSTRSPDFPTTSGAFNTTLNGMFDLFITKINATGTGLVYSTFLGGADMDGGGDLAVDMAGNVIVAGGTSSANFPVTPGAHSTVMNGTSDAFVTKINPAGSALLYSTFLGGSQSDSIGGIELDADGNSYLAGGTSSLDFPVTAGAVDTSFNGGSGDVFVAELNSTGSALLYSTFLGGSNSEGASDLARGADGALYITGQTLSSDFPTTAGALDRVFNGDLLVFWADAFVSKITLGTGTPPPPPPPPTGPSLSSVVANPSTVVGGNPSQGTVVLTSAAPAGGLLVTLSSNNAAASVPGNVNVPQGATTAGFTITTNVVTVSTGVTITGVAAGVMRTASLTVTPQSQPPSTSTLTVTATGRSGERVTSSPAGINVAVGSSGSASFATGTSITLSATNGRSVVWSGACSSGGQKTRTCTFTLTGNASVTANVK